ncbi:MAG TPA: transcription termination factor Rho [Dermatophilaceae bacterium]|nr:transcription termination factor Rho [Dermatophilaceae bacterium]
MTDTIELAPVADSGAGEPPARGGSLSSMRLAELQSLAAGLGLTGVARMRKGDLVTAIRARQGGTAAGGARGRDDAATQAPGERAQREQAPGTQAPGAQAQAEPGQGEQAPPLAQSSAAIQGPTDNRPDNGSDNRPDLRDDRPQGRDDRLQGRDDQAQSRDNQPQGRADSRTEGTADSPAQGTRPDGQPRSDQRGYRSDNRNDNRNDNRGPGGQGGPGSQGGPDGEDRNSRRRNRQRSRDRKRRGQGGTEYAPAAQVEQVEQVNDDDVLVPVAGILDVLENYAFVRTSGYLPGSNDVYVPLGLVKKNGLRKGDAVTGAVKAMRESELANQRQKFNALVRLDTVNGMSPEDARNRVEFGKLTPLYPQERLRLESEAGGLTGRIIDLIAPIGKGQRGLIVSPSKAGKTMIMQSIANAITTNNPEVHLMVVLVDERPEEVTDFQRAVKGEVIASTFDRPAIDHTTVAELSIERAKRLVEMGHDVVVLLDGITRLGRAYNLAAPASGRILSGGVDSSALYPPKRFFGAARNIEHGGSLTILATALVETNSKMDEVIFEEFKGTGNMELRLTRSLADRRIYPAVDLNASSTRREEILMSAEELKIVWKLRRVLSALDQQQGIELLLDRLKKTRSNVEFLMQVQKTSSIQVDDD